MEIRGLVSLIAKICQRFKLSEKAETGMLETHHFAKWSFVLLGCIIKSSL